MRSAALARARCVRSSAAAPRVRGCAVAIGDRAPAGVHGSRIAVVAVAVIATGLNRSQPPEERPAVPAILLLMNEFLAGPADKRRGDW
jgi:hypothetical protein